MRLVFIALLVLLGIELNAQNPDSVRRERYLDIGTGLFTVGDFLWDYNYSDFPSIRPSYVGFILLNRETNSKSLPLSITYKRQRKTKRLFWYTQLLLEFARNRNNTKTYYYVDYQGVYSNIWGFEYQYIKRPRFIMSLKLGAGVSIFHYIANSNEPSSPFSFEEGPVSEIFPFPAIEVQPFCFRFGNKDAMYINLSLGTTGFIQLGYSRKW